MSDLILKEADVLPKAGLGRWRIQPWTSRELVTIGVFAAIIKASTILVAMLGGGMNPVSLLAKNCLYVTLMVVLMHKVPRTGTLALTAGLTALVSLLILGQGMLSAPAAILAALLGEGLILLLGGYSKGRNIVIGLIFAELATKAASLGISWLAMREQPGMVVVASIFVSIGALGSFIGGWTGLRFTKELRHAGLIS